MERREFLESSALGLGGLAMASAVVASACAEAAEESMQTKAIDTVREWDPAKAEAYLKVNTNPWTNGVLDIKGIELICVGLNAACTNLQPEPTRRHIRAALRAGATRRGAGRPAFAAGRTRRAGPRVYGSGRPATRLRRGFVRGDHLADLG